MNRRYLMLATAVICTAFFAPLNSAHAAQPVIYVYGPDGPLPAIKEAAAQFGKLHNVDVKVTGGPNARLAAGC